MVRTNRPTAAVGVIAALTVVLAGCTSGDDPAAEAPSASGSASASPTASPKPADPAKAAEQDRIDDALSRYEEYLEIDEKHQKAGTNGYEDLALYLGHPDVHSNEEMKWDYIAEHGYKMVGDRKPVVSLANAEYDGDPLADTISGHRVHLDVCLDTTGFKIVDADGKTVPAIGSGPDKVIANVIMQGQPSEQWTIREDKSTKTEC